MSPGGAVALHALSISGLLWLAGKALVDRVPDLARRPAWARAGWAFLLGTAIVGCLLYALSHLAHMPLRRGWILAVILPLAAAGLVGRLRRAVRPRPSARAATLERWGCRLAAAVGLVVSLALFADAASGAFQGWDARMTWAAHARYVQAAGTVDAAALREGVYLVAHPTYPLLLPVLQVAVMEISGLGDERAARALYALFLPALLLVVADLGSRLSRPVTGAALAVTVAALPAVTFEREAGAASGYSDLPLAAYWGSALLLLALGRPRASTGVAAGVLGAAALLTKREGRMLAALLLAAAAIRWWQESRATPRPARQAGAMVLGCAVPIAAAAALYASWSRGITTRGIEDYLHVVRQGEVGEALGRLPAIVAEMGLATLSWDWWHGFWIAALILMVAGWRGLRRPETLVVLPPLAAAAGVYLAAYVLSPWGAEVVSQVRVSWGRLLLHLLLPVLGLLAMAWGAIGRGSWRPQGAAIASRPIPESAGTTASARSPRSSAGR